MHCVHRRDSGKQIHCLIKGVDGSCNKYKTHEGKDKGDVKSTLYLTSNGTNLFLKPLVSLTTGYANQSFISQLGEYLSKYTIMAIVEEVNRTTNTSTEGFEEASYFGKIETAGIEVIDELACGDPGSSAKRIKNPYPQKLKPLQIQ